MHPLSLYRKITFLYLSTIIFLSKRRKTLFILIASFFCVFVFSTLSILYLLSLSNEGSINFKCFGHDFDHLPNGIVTNRISSTDPRNIVFGGNGHIGFSAFPENIFFWNYSLSKELNFLLYIPDIHSNCPEVSLSSVRNDGILYIYRCCLFEKSSFPFKYAIYAHRTRPSILVQTFDVKFGRIDLTRNVAIGKKENLIYSRHVMLNSTSRSSHEKTSIALNYTLNVSTVITSSNARSTNIEVAVLAVAYPEPSWISISALNSKHSATFIYGLRLSPPRSISTPDLLLFTSPNSSFHLDALVFGESLLTELSLALNEPEARLRDVHVAAWNQLWNAGLSISHSIVPKVPNTENIMEMFYALLSATPIGTENHLSLMKNALVGQTRNYCYTGPYTLDELELWLPITTFNDLIGRINSWKYILTKYGCRTLLESGPEATLQALLRSSGAIIVTEDHLALVAPLHTLHRELSYRGLQLSKPGLSVSVDFRFVNHEISAQPQLELSVQLSQSILNHSLNVFACSAGCLSSPLKLGFSRTEIPIFQTNPKSPFLYISADSKDVLIRISKQHNFNELSEKFSLRHDLLALHEHGTSFGGLPIIFWFLFVLLIFVFHLLLIKIVCNELINTAKTNSRKNRMECTSGSLQTEYA